MWRRLNDYNSCTIYKRTWMNMLLCISCVVLAVYRAPKQVNLNRWTEPHMMVAKTREIRDAFPRQQHWHWETPLPPQEQIYCHFNIRMSDTVETSVSVVIIKNPFQHRILIYEQTDAPPTKLRNDVSLASAPSPHRRPIEMRYVSPLGPLRLLRYKRQVVHVVILVPMTVVREGPHLWGIHPPSLPARSHGCTEVHVDVFTPPRRPLGDLCGHMHTSPILCPPITCPALESRGQLWTNGSLQVQLRWGRWGLSPGWIGINRGTRMKDDSTTAATSGQITHLIAGCCQQRETRSWIMAPRGLGPLPRWGITPLIDPVEV